MPVKTEHQPQPLTVTVGGEQVPKALLTAFAQPSKDKKPFSYFSSGDKPDLTGHPSPSAIRKSNPLLNAPSVPRVFPIVSDQDLQLEEQRLTKTPNQAYSGENDTRAENDMATLTHAQYNSPMPLYSNNNVQQVVQQTQDFLHNRPHSAASGQFNPSQSGAYRLLQETGQIGPSRSARLEEQVDEYPHYRGFVDPRVQSPSFKRLQYVTGMDSGAEDEITHELNPPVKSRMDEIRSSAESRQSAGSQHESRSASNPVQEEYKPQWAENLAGPRVAQRDPTVDEFDHDQQPDPIFAARIGEAERPKVPPPVVPTWARKAEEKQQKWQHHGDRMQQRQYEYHPPRATWQSDVRKVQDKWDTHHGTSRLDTDESGPRAKSAEPYGRQARPVESEGSREFMKPYMAPTVTTTKFAPPAQPSYSPLSSYSRSSSKLHEYSSAYQPASDTPRPYSSQSTASSAQHREYTSSNPQQYQSSQPAYPEYSRGPSPRKPVNVATLVSGEALNPGPQAPTVPTWSKHAEYKKTVWESKRRSVDPDYQPRTVPGEPAPPWAHRAEQTHSLWQNEADAWRQRQTMETDLKHRATSAGPEPSYTSSGGRGTETRRYQTTSSSNVGATPSWRQRPVPHEATSYTGGPVAGPAPHEATSYTGGPGAGAAPPAVQWQQAPGGETKTQSSGSYYDRDGNQVSYTKEAYTSSDPGKEYSMLSEEEKKILEQPLQPGAVSRHMTKKYYKKTTRTSSTTSSTSQTPPKTTVTRYEYSTPNPTPRPLDRGVSEY